MSWLFGLIAQILAELFKVVIITPGTTVEIKNEQGNVSQISPTVDDLLAKYRS
jgi:hypothetical protein